MKSLILFPQDFRVELGVELQNAKNDVMFKCLNEVGFGGEHKHMIEIDHIFFSFILRWIVSFV